MYQIMKQQISYLNPGKFRLLQGSRLVGGWYDDIYINRPNVEMHLW